MSYHVGKKKKKDPCFALFSPKPHPLQRGLHATDQMLSFSNISGQLTAQRETGIWQPCPCQGERHDFLKWVNLDFSFLSAGEALTGCLLGGTGRWMMVVIWWKSTISHAWHSEKKIKLGRKVKRHEAWIAKNRSKEAVFLWIHPGDKQRVFPYASLLNTAPHLGSWGNYSSHLQRTCDFALLVWADILQKCTCNCVM